MMNLQELGTKDLSYFSMRRVGLCNGSSSFAGYGISAGAPHCIVKEEESTPINGGDCAKNIKGRNHHAVLCRVHVTDDPVAGAICGFVRTEQR
jgi:hypothetical protein